MDTRNQTEKKTECRALVPLQASAAGRAGVYHAAAAFLVQLSANVKGFAQYRAKRREQPEIGARVYRSTVPAALSAKPNGSRIDYCA